MPAHNKLYNSLILASAERTLLCARLSVGRSVLECGISSAFLLVILGSLRPQLNKGVIKAIPSEYGRRNGVGVCKMFFLKDPR